MALPLVAAQGHDRGLTINPQNIYTESATQGPRIGTRLWLGERTFHYAHAAAAIDRGQMLEGSALGGADTTAQIDLAIPTAIVVGQGSIIVTTLTTAQVKDRFAEGYLTIVSDTIAHGAGQTFKIKGHPAVGAGGALEVELYDEVAVAITTDCKASLTVNMWELVKETAVTTAVGMPVGVSLVSVTSDYYFWCQTWGPIGTLTGSTVIVDSALIRGLEAGEADIQTTNGITPEVGFSIEAGADGDYPLSFLTICP